LPQRRRDATKVFPRRAAFVVDFSAPTPRPRRAGAASCQPFLMILRAYTSTRAFIAASFESRRRLYMLHALQRRLVCCSASICFMRSAHALPRLSPAVCSASSSEHSALSSSSPFRAHHSSRCHVAACRPSEPFDFSVFFF